MNLKITLAVTCIFLNSSIAQAALVRLDISTGVLFNTATSVYPGVDIDDEDIAYFSLTYESNTAPAISDASAARYSIIGEATLTIGSFSWDSPSFELTVSNDPATLSPSDSIEFRSTMTAPAPFTESHHEVFFEFGSGNLGLLSSTDLPATDNDIDQSIPNIGNNFSIRPPSGIQPRWVINGVDLQALSVTPIPEPSSLFLLIAGILTLSKLRRR